MAPPDVGAALNVIAQSTRETHALLQQLVQATNGLQHEMAVMNRQLFGAGAPAAAQPTPAVPAAPVATLVEGNAPQPAEQLQAFTAKCASIGISRTMGLGRWKLNLYLYGYLRPAIVVSENPAWLLRFLEEVWGEANLEHFNTEEFNAKDTAERRYERTFTLAQPFNVDCRESIGSNGKKYVYAIRAYPC